MGDICQLRGLIVDNVINPTLWLIFAIGLLVFVFGVVEFVWGLNAQTDARNRGKQHMFWGLVGMFIMFVSLSIVYIIMNAVGATPDRARAPTACRLARVGCAAEHNVHTYKKKNSGPLGGPLLYFALKVLVTVSCGRRRVEDRLLLSHRTH